MERDRRRFLILRCCCCGLRGGSIYRHVPFGLVQGEDGKKFKTRAGDTVKLRDLLDEAVRIANEDLSKRYEESGDAPADLDR